MAQFYNTCEVDDFVRTFQNDPVLGPGANYLSEYRDIINENSDGWAYWSHGRKCSDSLSELLCKAINHQRYERFRSRADEEANPYNAPARADIVKACRKIELFMKRHESLQNIKPPTLADATQLRLV